MGNIYEEMETYRIACCEANTKVEQLQAEVDHLSDLIDEVREEAAEYKRTFNTDTELEAETESLKVLLTDKRTISKEDAEFLAGVSSENIDLKVENDRLKEGYNRIETWRKAYPLAI